MNNPNRFVNIRRFSNRPEVARYIAFGFVVALAALIGSPTHANPAPPGFEFSTYTDDVPNARQMALGDDGVLYVGTRRAGVVYAVIPTDGEPRVVTIARDLTMPSGLAFADGDLYVGALNEIWRFPDIATTRESKPTPELITDALPTERHHGWKYLDFGPDGDLFVPVGAPCNICLSKDERFASILRMDPRTGDTKVVAHGVRNSVGFDWHPETGELWFSDNGRDMMGDDVPPEEINRLTADGEHFGYPFIHAGGISDPKFGKGHDATDYVEPVVEIQAHSAALGLAFYDADQFPARFHNALFVAEHGSWNRSSKVGYRVSVVLFEDGEPRYEPFLDHWLDGEKASGRPNDVIVAPNGDLLGSDDQAGAIYRVRYTGS